ncbi:hypothetical protein KJ953_02250 [Patescibacteria group bacterium]|nr:hypothetical protein [Patescibacteria group bacterium]MBU1256226.1 hypothetical protein [Patescibacteria group bacterium]MBU1457685.1 hypothetical protein [Patescibacteria group bacterium]
MEKQNKTQGQERINPLRPSELVAHPDFLTNIEPLVLSDKERTELAEFEQPLFEKIKKLRGIMVSTHVIYPGAFTNKEGSKVFNEVYLGKDDVEKQDSFSEEEIIKKILSLDLADIPVKDRKKGNFYSSKQAKEIFAHDFQIAEGDVEEIPNPERITKIVDPRKLVKKLQDLRNFKKRLKIMTQEHGGNSNIEEAKKRIIGLYQRYVNVLIASKYDLGRILASQTSRTEQEEKALGLLRGRLSQESASRTLEKIDHFIAGTGLKISKNGLLKTLPERLSEYIETRANEPIPKEAVTYQKYNNYQVNASQAALLGQVPDLRYTNLKSHCAKAILEAF